jgi:hypothetical protein
MQRPDFLSETKVTVSGFFVVATSVATLAQGKSKAQPVSRALDLYE